MDLSCKAGMMRLSHTLVVSENHSILEHRTALVDGMGLASYNQATNLLNPEAARCQVMSSSD